MDANNREHLPAVMSLVDENAVFEGGTYFCMTQRCAGKAAFQREIEWRFGNHNRSTLLTIRADGDPVAARLEGRSALIDALGLNRILITETVQVVNGLMTS